MQVDSTLVFPSSEVKDPAAMQEMQDMWVQSLDGKRSAGGGQSNPLQHSHLGNPHGQKRLAGYSPQGRKESDMAKAS